MPGPRPENPSLTVPSGDQHEPAVLAPQPVPAAARRVPSLPALRRPLGFGLSGLFGGIGSRRLLLAGVILVAGLPLLTIALVAGQSHLSLADDLLIYLVAVVGVAVVGGFWPAVLGAVTSSLLLNWYFTRPVHTFTIEDPQNLLALLLFVTVAVTVSSVVHLAAHRALQAARSSEEAAELLALAQTVLGGADTPTAVLDHLTGTRGGRAELVERVGTQWFRVAVSGTPRPTPSRSGSKPGPAWSPSSARSPAGHSPAAGWFRRAGRRRAGPGTAADPGRPGRGAGRGQPDADRAAPRRQP